MSRAGHARVHQRSARHQPLGRGPVVAQQPRSTLVHGHSQTAQDMAALRVFAQIISGAACDDFLAEFDLKEDRNA